MAKPDPSEVLLKISERLKDKAEDWRIHPSESYNRWADILMEIALCFDAEIHGEGDTLPGHGNDQTGAGD
jgi:hypothetical protein